jgi:hypothetical protein
MTILIDNEIQILDDIRNGEKEISHLKNAINSERTTAIAISKKIGSLQNSLTPLTRTLVDPYFDNAQILVTDDVEYLLSILNQIEISPDEDSDGIFDDIDLEPESPSLEFKDHNFPIPTFGRIASYGDQNLKIKDFESPDDGVEVFSDPFGGKLPAKVITCVEDAELMISAGEHWGVECGSVTIEVFSGEIEIKIPIDGGFLITSLESREKLTIDIETFTITAGLDNPKNVSVFINGQKKTILPGETTTFTVPPTIVGGKIIPIETTSLILSWIQTSAAWLMPVVISSAGIGLIILQKRVGNKTK